MISGTSSSNDRETREDVGCGGAFSTPEQPATQISTAARIHRRWNVQEWHKGGQDSVIDKSFKSRWRAEAVQSIRIPPPVIGSTFHDDPLGICRVFGNGRYWI